MLNGSSSSSWTAWKSSLSGMVGRIPVHNHGHRVLCHACSDSLLTHPSHQDSFISKLAFEPLDPPSLPLHHNGLPVISLTPRPCFCLLAVESMREDQERLRSICGVVFEILSRDLRGGEAEEGRVGGFDCLVADGPE